MGVIVSLYSDKEREIARFLNSFYKKNMELKNDLTWEYCFKNPTESADLVGVYIDNKEDFKINMWISFDEGFYINVTDFNADRIIRYLFERYPY